MSIDLREMPFAPRLVWVILPVLSGIPSIIGSALIMYMIIHGRRTGTFHRFMMGLSVCDLVSSLCLSLTTLPFRRDSGAIGALGNQQTCSARGFISSSFALAALFYNTGLALYYLLMIRSGVQNRSMIKYEIATHILAFVVPLLLGVVGLALGIFNPTSIPEISCWAGPYPVDGCKSATSQCERGLYYREWGWTYASLQLLLVLVITVCTTGLYRHIRVQGNRIRRIVRRAPSGLEMREREVANQGFLFVLACLSSQVWIFFGWLAVDTSPRWRYTIVLYIFFVVAKFFNPLQGFSNFFIFIRPRFIQRRKREGGTESRLTTLRHVIYDVPPSRRRTLDYSPSSRRLPRGLVEPEDDDHDHVFAARDTMRVGPDDHHHTIINNDDENYNTTTDNSNNSSDGYMEVNVGDHPPVLTQSDEDDDNDSMEMKGGHHEQQQQEQDPNAEPRRRNSIQFADEVIASP